MIKALIRSRSKILFNGEINTFTSFNATGEFDILENHATFISLLKKKIILDKNLESEKAFEIDSAVLSSHKNNIDIFVGL